MNHGRGLRASLARRRVLNGRLGAIGMALLRLRGQGAAGALRASGALPRRAEPPAGAARASWLVLVLREGRGEFDMDAHRHHLGPGDVLLARPGQDLAVHASTGLEADLLLIDAERLESAGAWLALGGGLAPVLQCWPVRWRLGANDLSAWCAVVTALRLEMRRMPDDPLAPVLARELLACALAGLGRCAAVTRERGTPQARLLNELVAQLDVCAATRPSVAQLARSMSVSTSTLSRICRQLLGQSAKGLIDQRVAHEAKRLLLRGDATGSTVAAQLGFTEPTNFFKFFRRLAGMTPEEFRARHRDGCRNNTMYIMSNQDHGKRRRGPGNGP